MRWGIESGELDPTLPYALDVAKAAVAEEVPVALLYAIAWHESIAGEVAGLWTAATVLSDDGGHGLCQLTSSWPDDWEIPFSNASFACSQFIVPAAQYWCQRVEGAFALVKCIAATYNAGLGNAVAGHSIGNVDAYTTDGYGAAVTAIFASIIETGKPSP
jgi:hypothetical protein